MAGKIPQHFIDDLLNRVDVVDVINRRVPLKKAGQDYSACCPFHDEKTPSFTVSPTKQFYHCFGCGAHGTALGFLMEYDRLSFPEAVEELARSAGLEVPREAGFEQGPDNRPLYDMLGQAARFFAWQLRHHPEAGRAVSYLQGRGLSGEIAAEFQIGFAPPGWDNLLSHLGRSARDITLLRDAGLIAEPDGKRYDRFRDRIMFPILDTRGRVIGFGGRQLDNGEAQETAAGEGARKPGASGPKYLNSPETRVFHKGRELYGLYQARKANKDLRRLLVVEGYMDVVALSQFGIRNAVATLGTATTAEHLEKLFRTTPEVVFCFDGDRAGRDAAWKALNTALPLLRDGRQASFLFLPEGEDPDTLVRQIGQDAFVRLIDEAQPLPEFLFDKLGEQTDLGRLDGRARLGELASPLIEQIPGNTLKAVLRDKLALLSGTRHLSVAGTPQRQGRTQRPPARQGLNTLSPVRRAIALLLQNPEIATATDLPEGWRELTNPGLDVLKQLLENLRANPHLNTAALVEREPDEKLRQLFGQLAATALETHDDAVEQFRGVLQRLEKQALEAERTRLAKLPLSALSDAEKQRLRELYRLRDTLKD